MVNMICDKKVLVSHMPLFAAASVLPISSLTVAYMKNKGLCYRWVLHLLAALSLSNKFDFILEKEDFERRISRLFFLLLAYMGVS